MTDIKKLVVIITVMLIGVIGVASYIFAQDGFDIKVENKTNREIYGLYLTYENSKSDIKIPSIASGEKYDFNVTPTEDFTENAIKLQYKDKNGKLHTEYVFGYIEKGYSGDAVITLKSINANGEIEIGIKENTSLY